MSLFYMISTSWAVVSFFLLLFAWRMAVVKNITLHKKLMIFLTIGAWIFIISYLLQSSHGKEALELPRAYILWLAFHGTLGLIPLMGSTSLVISRLRARGDNNKTYLNRHHKNYGTVFIYLWLFSHLGGIFNVFLVN